MNASIEKTIETLLDKIRSSSSNTDQAANLTSVVERLMKLLVPPMLFPDTTEPSPTTALEGGKAYDARWNGHEWIITKKPKGTWKKPDWKPLKLTPDGTVNPHEAENAILDRIVREGPKVSPEDSLARSEALVADYNVILDRVERMSNKRRESETDADEKGDTPPSE